ncbi:hypothetical protein V5E97_34975 [Singulisphaera sp. Ch08]|uniref:Glycosyltransferase n=1 Tax=Singulisphaera sp. Ch08 TaxID=3120278 RepID=A0AAU7CE18_9BACT
MSEPTNATPLRIYTLLCNRDVDRALGCLSSLHSFCRDPFQQTIIDDGSLMPRDIERLHEAIPALEILSREEVEDQVGPKLQGKVNCQLYRKNHIFALKLIDSAMLSPGAFAQCDGDVLFLRPFQGFDRRPIGGEDVVFMKDSTTAYSISYLNRHFRHGRLRLPQFVNAGFMYADAGVFDLDFIEWFLGREEFRRHAWVMEQTAWAALGGRCRTHYFAPEQVAFPRGNMYFRDDSVCLHFISPLRHHLDDREYTNELTRRSSAHYASLAMLRTEPALYAGPLRDLSGRLYRRLRLRD